MPLYDNIVDALALTQDAASHTVSLTTVGGSQETNETTYLGNFGATAWMKFDLEAYPEGTFIGGYNVQLDVSVANTSGNPNFFPVVFAIKVTDNTWDPTTPDFDKTDTAGSTSLGDGTVNPPPVTIEFYGGSRDETGSFLSDMSQTGQWYLLISDWNGVETGSLDLTYTLSPAAPTITNILAGANGGKASVTVGADYINDDDNYDYDDTGAFTDFPNITDIETTFTISGADIPAAGRYRLYARLKSASNPGENFVCQIRRNGFPLTTTSIEAFGDQPAIGTSYKWIELTDQHSEFPDISNYTGPNTIPIVTGDEFEFSFSGYFISGLHGSGGDLTIFEELRWFPEETGGSPGDPIQLLEIPDLPVGWSDLATPANFLHNPTGSIEWQKDLCVTDNGDVYIMFFETITPGETEDLRAVIHKWNGTTWSLIDDDPFGVGGDGSFPFVFDSTGTGTIMSFTMDTDGEDLFIAFGKNKGNYDGTGDADWGIHVRTYDVSGASWTTLGGEIVGKAASTYAASPGSPSAAAPQIKCSPSGVPWVTFCQNDPDVGRALFECQMPFAFYWNGATWVDAQIPEPTNPHSDAYRNGNDLAVVDFYTTVQVDLTFCQSDGLGENPTVAYYTYYAVNVSHDAGIPQYEWWFWEYGGTPGSWTSQHFNFGDLYDPPGDPTVIEFAQGFSLVNDGETPILASAQGTGGSQDYGVYIAKVDPNGGIITFPTVRPFDSEVGLWIDPTGCDVVVTDDGSIWLTIDSNFWAGGGSWMIKRVAEDGTGGGACWASRRNNSTGLWLDNGSMHKTYAKGNLVYSLCDTNHPDTGEYVPTLWEIPFDPDPYIPWAPAIPLFGPIGMRYKH